MHCSIVGIPVQAGARQPGCIMGPDAYRTAGLATQIGALGHTLTDHGNLAATPAKTPGHANPHLKRLDETAGWIHTIGEVTGKLPDSSDMVIFLGGDHILSAGTVPAMAQRAARQGRQQFVLWLDAHTDLHTLQTTASGHLHGTPVAYFVGLPGFEGYYPDIAVPVPACNVCMMGIRSVDEAERAPLSQTGIRVHDMRHLDENGVAAPLRAFLDWVRAENGMLHVSFDVDFLDPAIAPGVGAPAPAGATIREAHLIMQMLCDSGLATSLDLAELNPFLDERGRTATLMVDLCASLLGRKVLDRPTRSY